MDILNDEVESLEAILMEDVTIARSTETGAPEMIETTIFPTVGEDTDRQYICVTLQVVLQPGYPDVSPKYNLLKPRGLDDQRLNEIKTACSSKLTESLGFPVVFDLIEIIREHLTGSNLPSGQCVVCLYGFSDGDEFTKSECFHYLHSYCLARHLNASRRNYQEEQDKLPAWLKKTADPFQALCPVCREPISDEVDNLTSAPPPAELDSAPDFKLTRDLKELQAKMTNLFLQQKSRGAIIDIEAESGSVISIQPEEEARREQNIKNGITEDGEVNGEGHGEQLQNDEQCANTVVQTNAQHSNNSRHQNNSRSNQPNANCNANSSVNTNFAPVVTQTQRIASDPTNNNHYNRRHYRGGRRHQHHHHHRDRDHRDRHENNSSSHSASQQQQQQQQTPQAPTHSGRHQKSQATSGGSTR